MLLIFQEKNGKLFANFGDLGQIPHSAASDLGMHYLQIISLWGLQSKMS